MARAATTTEDTTAPQRTVVYLGNRKAIEKVGEGADAERRPLTGKRCTIVIIPEGTSLMDSLRDIASPQGIWAAHSNAEAPAWVAAEGPMAAALTSLLAAQYPGVEVRDPDPQEG